MRKTTLLIDRLLITIGFILIPLLGFSQSQIYNSSSTFTVPAGVTTLDVQAWGAGGGGSSATSNGRGGGGGGGGAYAANPSVTVSALSAAYTVTVGTGGGANTAGGNSSFSTLVIAAGGTGGTSNANTLGAGGTIANSTGTIIYAGGNGANGVDSSYSGGGGSSAGTISPFIGVNASNATGAPATTGGGKGGDGRNGSQGAGSGGSNPGGGGGGAYRTSNNQTGGIGGNGRVIIAWTCPTYSLTSTAASSTTVCTSATPTITLTANAANLPVGTYSVNYTRTGANAGTTNVTNISVTTAGTLSFTSTALGTAGTTTFTINTISSGTSPSICSSAISTNNTVVVTVQTTPTVTTAALGSIAQGGTKTLSGSSVGGSATGAIWTVDVPGGTFTNNGGSSPSFATWTPPPTYTGTATLTLTSIGGCSIVTGTTRTLAVVGPPTITSLGATSGCEGSSITINGTNLTGATAANVKIGGLAVSSISSNNGTTLVAVIGNGITGAVTVTTIGGTVTSSTPFTVLTKPIITGKSFICSGSQQTYSVVSSPGVTYAWSFTGTWTIVSGTGNPSNSITLSSLSNGTITVIATNTATGCTTNATLAISSGTPAQPSTISGGSGPCIGNETVYSITNVPGITYTWNVPANCTIIRGNGTNSITILPTTTASGTITVTPSITCGGTTTNGTARNLSITPVTTPTITNTTDGSVTAPGGVLTTAMTATASAGTISWWTLPSSIGETAIATGSSYSPNISQTKTYYVSTSNGGCTSARIPVTANVTTANIVITGNNVVIPNSDTTPSLSDWTDYGSTQIIRVPLIKTFTIKNTTTSIITIPSSAITLTGNLAAYSVNSQPTSGTLAAGASLTFSVKFNPLTTTGGAIKTTITFNYTLSGPETYVFDIQATGIQNFYDSDGDGVFDDVDIDDDNDGIIDINEELDCRKFSSNQVNYKFLNETFGAGNRTSVEMATLGNNASSNYCYEDGTVSSGNNTTECPQMDSSDLNDGKYTVAYSAIVEKDAIYPIASWAKDFWYRGTDHTGDSNGRMAIFNANYLPGIFYTASVTGILPGVPITYSFWALNLDRLDADKIDTRLRPNIKIEFQDVNGDPLRKRDPITGLISGLADFSTGEIDPSSIAGNLASDWHNFEDDYILVDASNNAVSSFKVVFTNLTIGGLGNDLALDDIQITQTLCDFEGDTVADLFDLDSDDDGIPDTVEAGYGYLSGGLGRLTITTANDTGVRDGLLDSIATAANILSTNTTSATYDFDGDKMPNYIDLDSDNDSLFDVDESGAGNSNAVTFQNGDGDINGDGTGDGIDSETFRQKDSNGDGVPELYGDGILDIYEFGAGINQYGNSGQGTANLTYPAATYLKDTDNDGIPDYLDIMSNGSIFDIANTLKIYDYKTLDTNNDGIIDGNADADKDGILDAFDTAYSPPYFGSPRDLYTKLFLDFDGRNDYGQSTAILGGLANASLMAWIDLHPSFANDGVIIGQDNFQIRINSSRKLEVIVNGSTYTHNTVLDVSRWYNVATTYDGSNVKMYLNGVLVETIAASGAISADASLLTIGKNPSTNTQYFKGKIDEVRVFSSALTDSQLQRMVYQEIKDFGGEIRGEIVPKNIATTPSLPFSNLLRYYRMDTYKDDIIDDLTTAAIDLTGTKIYNHKNIYVQQAPMPFITEQTGDFATAVNSTTNDVRGLDIMDYDYSIVKVKHNITETSNTIDLGMLVDPGVTVVMNNDNKIQNDWYLKLDGKIDLVDKSQLVQTTESDLDVTSSGFIERDQQGQSNLYNYNYWSSPVSPINTSSNNTDYSIDGIMRDGTNPTSPSSINWVGGYDGSPTSPISIAEYWLYKFDNLANDYYNWQSITPNSLLRVGQGFTMKGSGAATNQNYVFTGKPNNGLINSNTVSSDQLMLAGNPYPSSLNATAFITDNIASNTIDGTLYFWEHYATNLTHILSDYQGGYAERNLVGGVPPVSPTLISGLGSSTRIPGQFIPVGQGFFVNGKPGAGGAITFKNSQRSFHKENEAPDGFGNGGSNTLFKTKGNQKTKITTNNDNDPVVKDTLMRIRLGFNSNNNYHRQVLLGFMNEKATNGMDYGYDALNIDDYPNDMYFLNGENQLVIQGEGYFNADTSYPIGVKTDTEGKVSFSIDALENFDGEQKVYIYDAETKTYNEIQKNTFEVTIPAGENNTRFSLHFKDKSSENDKTLGLEENNADNNIKIAHIQNSKTLNIYNYSLETSVEKVTLFNINGQTIANWKIENQDQKNIQIPINSISSGVYVAKLKTSTGELNKKIIIK